MDAERERIIAETVGWTWAEACTVLDRGEDPRTKEMPEVLDRALKDLG